MSDLHYFHRDWIVPTDEHLTVDVCVYGGSSAGVTAACIAAERGHRVVLLNPAKHLGGMTTGGLGWTDFGRQHVIGGRSRRFYQQVGGHYGKDIEWRFEPHVAAAVYDQWVSDAGLDVRHAQFLDQVAMDGQRITGITLLGGLRVKARQFIDATYEGDLMARAGVSYHVGRESNRVYGEELNGIQVRDKHQFVGDAVDPYVTPGDPLSGLLPQVEPVDLARRQGEGDHRVQAYCFRMCMTDDPALKIDWARPERYEPAWYELAVRWFNAAQERWNDQFADGRDRPKKFDVLSHSTPGGHRKTDTNNHGAVSSDFIGMNWAWPEATYARREVIFQDHVRYQQGLYWTLANDDRIPENVRHAYGTWGLAKDEFVDTEHWPHQLYVREARRLTGDYIVTEADCRGTRRPNDAVGMGSYTMDSHNCTRFVHLDPDSGPRVMNDGDVQVSPTDPYPLSYRAIVPGRGQCENLIVPVCFGASHIAYGSARMEPVFMVLGESAALAAELAMQGGVPVQDVPYGKLRSLLDAAGQVCEL